MQSGLREGRQRLNKTGAAGVQQEARALTRALSDPQLVAEAEPESEQLPAPAPLRPWTRISRLSGARPRP